MLPVPRNVVDSRKSSQQSSAEFQDSQFLFPGSSVTITPVIIQASNISNPDRMGVVAFAVRALNINRTPDVNRPIPIDNIMVPDVLPLVVGNVVPSDRFNSDASVDFRASAVKHNLI